MNRNKQYIKWLSWTPAILMMVIIFIFSAKTAEVSDATSSPIADAIIRVFEAMFGKMDESRRLHTLDTMNFLVRKTAHMTEYAILAICINIGFWSNQMKEKKRFFLAWVVSVMYACSDEYHQTFVEGRSGSLKDVGIDSVGVLIGCLLFLLIVRCFRKKKNKRIAIE